MAARSLLADTAKGVLVEVCLCSRMISSPLLLLGGEACDGSAGAFQRPMSPLFGARVPSPQPEARVCREPSRWGRGTAIPAAEIIPGSCTLSRFSQASLLAAGDRLRGDSSPATGAGGEGGRQIDNGDCRCCGRTLCVYQKPQYLQSRRCRRMLCDAWSGSGIPHRASRCDLPPSPRRVTITTSCGSRGRET